MDAQQAGIYQTNFRNVFGATGAGGLAVAGATVAGAVFGLLVAPYIAIPIMGAVAIAGGVSGGLLGYTLGEKIDYEIAKRRITVINPDQIHPIIDPIVLAKAQETADEVKEGCHELASMVSERGKQVFDKHLKGRGLMDIYEEQLLGLPPRPEVFIQRNR